MDLIITFISIDLIASKFLDCYIASYRPQHAENKFSLLSKILTFAGITSSPWFSFFATVALTGAAMNFLGNFYAINSWHWLFTIIGLYTTILNLGSAHSGYFMRTNFITRRLLPQGMPMKP